jgi:hypothetical protein
MNELKPRGRPDVHTRATSRQRMLYDSSTNTFHVLNETAEFIWTLCDGRHTLRQMEERIRAHFDVPPAIDLQTDIEHTIVTLRKKGLLEDPGNGDGRF